MATREGNRVLIYERISMDKENLDNQEFALLNLCKEKGWVQARNPIREVEHGEIGQRWENGELVEDRLGLMGIIADAKERRFDILIVWHKDRLTRGGGSTLVNYIRQFDSMGVKIYDYQDGAFLNIDATSTDEIVRNVQGFGARVYIEDIKKKTKNALERIQAEIKTNGYHISKKGNKITRLGKERFAVGKKGEQRHVLTTEELAEIVRRRQEGESLRSIANSYNCSAPTILKVIRNQSDLSNRKRFV